MSPRNEEHNKLIRDKRSEQILQAALKVFARKGLAATKISDIATEAGLSYGLVYHYFTSKDEIFTMLVGRALKGWGWVSMDAVQQKISPLDQLHRMTESILKGLKEENGAYYFLLVIQAFISDAVPEQVKEMMATGTICSPNDEDGLLQIIIAGQQAGQIVNDDPIKLWFAYYAMIQGIAIQEVQKTKGVSLPDTELILRLLKA